jgi:serine/threonine-protein kinase RsbW
VPPAGVLAEEAVVVPATAERLAALHGALARFWVAVQEAHPRPPDSAWRAAFETAVAEIGANIVRHAYPPGRAPGRLRLRLRAFPERIEARFNDRGVAFSGEPSRLLASKPPLAPGGPPDPADVPEGGYGLALVLQAVDRLDYARLAGGENRWRLVKRL